MSNSLAALINNVKANTANNTLLQRSLNTNKRKRSTSDAKPAKKPKQSEDDSTSGPKVVVFDESVLKKAPVIESRAARRAFMSSNVFKTATVEASQRPMTKKEEEEEEENNRNDLELNRLLTTTNLLEELQKEEMTGKEKRKHAMEKLESLGAKPAPKSKVPLAYHLGMEAKKKERELKRLQEAKDLGLYDKSLKHLYVTSDKKKKKKRDRDPGITTGIGRMKGGTLHISQSELSKVEQMGKKRPAKGKRR